MWFTHHVGSGLAMVLAGELLLRVVATTVGVQRRVLEVGGYRALDCRSHCVERMSESKPLGRTMVLFAGKLVEKGGEQRRFGLEVLEKQRGMS